MLDDPFITQPCFTISLDNASYFLTIPLAFYFCAAYYLLPFVALQQGLF